VETISLVTAAFLIVVTIHVIAVTIIEIVNSTIAAILIKVLRGGNKLISSVTVYTNHQDIFCFVLWVK